MDLAVLDLAPGDRVVDVGCGGGGLAAELALSGVAVTGVEPAAYLREQFRERMAVEGADAEVVEGVAERLPFPDASVAALTITEVLEHVADPMAALREIHRVLEPGGIVCLAVPTSFTEALYWRLHPAYADNATHVRIFSRPELRTSLRRAGFEVVRWEGRNFRAAVAWVGHALLRSPSDHAGVVLGNRWWDRCVDAVFHGLDLIRLGPLVDALGNRVWPKSWYVYARRR